MVKFCVLGSGSKGNAIYFSVDSDEFLVDCGFSKKEITKRLSDIGKDFLAIKRILVTHDHGDHRAPWIERDGFEDTPAPAGQVESFPLSHDGAGSCGYIIRDKSGNKVAIICDTGCIPEEVVGRLFDCQAVLVEMNYDIDLLAFGKYPTELLERIASDTGHLRNECAAELIETVMWPGLEYIVALHLSASHNRTELADFCMRATGTTAEIIVSDQKKRTKLVCLL